MGGILGSTPCSILKMWDFSIHLRTMAPRQLGKTTCVLRVTESCTKGSHTDELGYSLTGGLKSAIIVKDVQQEGDNESPQDDNRIGGVGRILDR